MPCVDGLHPIRAASDLTAEGPLLLQEDPPACRGEAICTEVEDRSGSELNTREKDRYKALGKEPNV